MRVHAASEASGNGDARLLAQKHSTARGFDTKIRADRLRKTRYNFGRGCLYDVDDVCRFLKVKRSTVYKLLQEKKLHAVKVGKLTRFGADDIWNYIDSLPDYENKPNIF